MTATNELLLSEEYVQNCFHSYLKSALTQAKAERLLGTDVLSSAEGDLMITGPALCLYFAALRCTTNPPSVPLPRLSKSQGPPTELSLANCPVTFRPFLIVWAETVPSIQALIPEHQHDLARIICGLSPIARPPNLRLNGIAADLRAVAIEISMRRTFQDRYAADLQAAIDAGSPAEHRSRVKASFAPPPTYDESVSPISPTFTSPSRSTLSLDVPTSPSSLRAPSPTPSSSSRRSPSPSPTIIGPAIELIRETLYAALGDVLERHASLRRLLRRDPARGYFASVSFAILHVATTSVHTSPAGEPCIRGVLGRDLTLSECPTELRPFMKELCDIGQTVHKMEEEDSEASVQALQEDKELPRPRLERVQEVLKGGVGWVYDENRSDTEDGGANGRSSGRESRRRTTSTENRAVAFANRINALSLGMTKLRAFKERQEAVFKVLIGVNKS
ncbi:hypothetical protein NM688_g5301 [Phlebia brevispora]|uniref:Uncharacterized protein n=1 Tax=Phlebia brevispora TaxID=194682 RepID=A0ACC1SXC7_9APHY|nr:hypothetical protein NM688_g5301 [Phlebia brevispora]